ncbi:polyketide cyclase [Trinickia dabaoshanensis]|uniref:Polyketide cyclase n=1 Tax=Trinickia dabaoshanensis TaxID=564714 RepID=A0A2N7VHJ5_9BURK|nr:SRPBCC family protein [Trinickia dabaoshanensis]PMS16623.1 polyketide cyclase [Trinickia dabaoshanensis]
MFSAFLIVGLLIIAAAACLLVYTATRPNEFHIARSVTIEAPPEAIYPLINDLRRFNEWNPFAKSDPTINLTYGASSEGRDGSYVWNGSGRSGKGRMQITETVPPQRIAMSLQFEKPMKANNTVLFTLKPQDAATDVSWEMSGVSSYMQKLFGVCFNMEKMVGGEFDKGLNSLKVKVEKGDATGAA